MTHHLPTTHLGTLALLVAALCAVAGARSLTQLPSYTREEVAANKWYIYEDKVLDMSEFRHPGGFIRMKFYAGKDATDVLNRKHSAEDRAQLAPFVIGNLA